MKKIFLLSLLILIIIASPVSVSAVWVDADRDGLGNILVYDSGDNDNRPKVAIDSQKRPHIVWVEGTGIGTSVINYLYWNGSVWVDADGTGTESLAVYTFVSGPSYADLKLNSLNQPGIAFGNDLAIYYLYWNGSAWVDADGTGQGEIEVIDDGGSITAVSLDFSTINRPSIAYSANYDGLPAFDSVSYLYWNGSAWVDADGVGQVNKLIMSDSNEHGQPSLLLNSSNTPCIAFEDGLAGNSTDISYLYWNGYAWVDADGTGQGDRVIYDDVDSSYMPSLGLTSDNRPAISWYISSGSDGEIYYLYWDGSAWVDTSGSGQANARIIANSGDSVSPSLAINMDNSYPSIAWSNDSSGSRQIYFMQWSGSSWVDVDGSGQEGIIVYTASGSSTNPSMVLASGPYISFSDNQFGDNDVYYIEWWVPSVSILPRTGNNLISYINILLNI